MPQVLVPVQVLALVPVLVLVLVPVLVQRPPQQAQHSRRQAQLLQVRQQPQPPGWRTRGGDIHGALGVTGAVATTMELQTQQGQVQRRRREKPAAPHTNGGVVVRGHPSGQ